MHCKTSYFGVHLCSVDTVSCIYPEFCVRHSGFENYIENFFLVGAN